MNWQQAVEAMKKGHHVHRESEQKRELIGDSDGIPIYECGMEASRLVAAWTVDGQSVLVFQGAGSKCMFIPDDEHLSATDWEIAP